MIRRPPRSTLFPTRRSSDLLRLPELRDVDGHDQRRTPTGEVDGVRNDIDLSDPTILQSMRPGPRVSSNRGVRLRPKSGQDRLEAWHLLGRSDVGDAHGEKLFASVAVVRDRRGVD